MPVFLVPMLSRLVGVVLKAFDSPRKRDTRLVAVKVIPVILRPHQPTSATRTMRCYHDAASGCLVL
ncbi:MAG TPA: hypothetical protein VNO32_65830, partial [Candidatus Acidoferrum sp.]|nr:hypothetical protein [Candidatus Acidoferrum sp.]